MRKETLAKGLGHAENVDLDPKTKKGSTKVDTNHHAGTSVAPVANLIAPNLINVNVLKIERKDNLTEGGNEKDIAQEITGTGHIITTTPPWTPCLRSQQKYLCQ